MPLSNGPSDQLMPTIRKACIAPVSRGGKKKAHTLKSLILGTADRYLHSVSRGWQGKCHDYRQLTYPFPPDQLWFSELAIELDLGYQDITKGYDCQSVSQAVRKPKV